MKAKTTLKKKKKKNDYGGPRLSDFKMIFKMTVVKRV